MDLQLFFPPFAQEFIMLELGVPQLTAHLSARGFRVRQADLNHLGLGPAVLQCDQEAPRFWQPSLRQGEGIWNRDAYAYPIDAVLDAVAAGNPESEIIYERHVRDRAALAGLVGFSINTVDQLVSALFLCRRIHEDFPSCKTCLGGPWVGISWEALSGWPELFSLADFMIAFSGEVPLEQLIRHVRGELPVSAVDNLAYRDGRTVRRTPVQPGIALEKTTPPALDGIDVKRYINPSLPYQTTQGCYWGRCDFCCHILPKKSFAVKSTEKMALEMAALTRLTKIRRFNFADLATPVDVMEEMAPHWRGLRLRWRALARVDERFTPACARSLRAAGCEFLHFGLETSDPQGLKRLRKGIRLKTVDANIRALAGAGIGVGLFVLNYPGQTEAEFSDSLEFCVARRHCLSDLISKRFRMGRNMQGHGLPGEVAPEAARDLNSFDVPYLGEGVSIKRYNELISKAEQAVFFSGAKNGKWRGLPRART